MTFRGNFQWAVKNDLKISKSERETRPSQFISALFESSSPRNSFLKNSKSIRFITPSLFTSGLSLTHVEVGLTVAVGSELGAIVAVGEEVGVSVSRGGVGVAVSAGVISVDVGRIVMQATSQSTCVLNSVPPH